MAKIRELPDVREYEGMGGRCTVARAFGGVVEFDDGSVFLMLTVAGHEGGRLVYPLFQGDGMKALDFMERFVKESQHEGGEGLTDFEKMILRAAIDHSMTDFEREQYKNPDSDNGIFWDLADMEDMEGDGEK